MKTLIDWLLDHPAVFAALGVWYWGYIRARKKELADPASLETWLPSLADTLRLARYHNRIQRALDRVDGFFGEKPFARRALVTCWFIAFVYPLMLFMLMWAAGGPHTLGVLELLPEGWNPAWRWGFLGASSGLATSCIGTATQSLSGTGTGWIGFLRNFWDEFRRRGDSL